MANRAFMNFGHMYANQTMPSMISMQFTVDNTNGLGVTSLKSNGYVKNVFMHSTSPSASNPNPQNGGIEIHLADNYNVAINCMSSIVQPLSGTNIAVTLAGAALTIGTIYTITVVGTTTEAQWHSLGLPAGLTPAVGQSFVAQAVGLGVGSGQVQVSISSGIEKIDLVPNPQSSLNPQGSSNQGAYIMLKAMGPTAAGNTAQIPTAPVNGSVILITLLMDNSSSTVDGL